MDAFIVLAAIAVTMPLTNSPQLQLFALAQIVYGVASIFNLFDTCALLTGRSCSQTEVFLLSVVGTFLFVIGIGFFLLTTIAYDDVPKKKRLTFVAMYCVSAQISAAILAGRTPTGIMPKGMHIAEVSVQIALFLILSTAVWGDLPLTGYEYPTRGGMTKIFNGVYSLFLLCWVYINSDAFGYSDVFAESDKSGGSSVYHFFSQAISVYSFEMFILYGFGTMYGTDDDNELLAELAIFQNVCLALQLIWFYSEGVVTATMVRIVTIETCVVAAIGLLAVFIQRKKRNSEYESLGGLVQ